MKIVYERKAGFCKAYRVYKNGEWQWFATVWKQNSHKWSGICCGQEEDFKSLRDFKDCCERGENCTEIENVWR